MNLTPGRAYTFTEGSSEYPVKRTGIYVRPDEIGGRFHWFETMDGNRTIHENNIDPNPHATMGQKN